DRFDPSQLTWHHPDGLEGPVVYTRDNTAEANSIPARAGTWTIVQEIGGATNRAANAAALNALMTGASGLHLKPVTSETPDLAALLHDIVPQAVSLDLELNLAPEERLEQLLAFVRSTQSAPEQVTGCLMLDPMGAALASGSLDEAHLDGGRLSQLWQAASPLPNYRIINVQGHFYQHAGASAVQELAFSLAQAHEYLHRLTEAGVPAPDVIGRLRFSLGIGVDYFTGLAMIRALRKLWPLVTAPYGVSEPVAAVHAVTSHLYLSAMDPHVNLLRATTAAMAAVLGGCDSLCVAPYDAPYATERQHSERLARNVQLLLQEEAYLDRVIDPASGSYYLESLTDQLAAAAWKAFQEVEASGGFLAAIRAGQLQEHVANSAAQKQAHYANEKLVMIGANKFRHPDNPLPHPPLEAPVDTPTGTDVQPLQFFRLSEPDERAADSPSA
ncbi:MAG: methylmalonyl-CoA mutase family protein, partial [Bacteroidota bacterium]